jgi:hypothetical protein
MIKRLDTIININIERNLGANKIPQTFNILYFCILQNACQSLLWNQKFGVITYPSDTLKFSAGV